MNSCLAEEVRKMRRALVAAKYWLDGYADIDKAVGIIDGALRSFASPVAESETPNPHDQNTRESSDE
jgi:hypothetical protein